MATVYLAIQQSFGREVALKVMASGLAHDPSFSERFLREAKIVAQLIHPNIVTVYDVGIADDHHYLSMEYVPGEDLKHAAGRLSLARKCDVIRQVAQALDFARLKGYIHRDVKPENIRLQSDSERVVLMDFGIAKATDVQSGVTQTGTAVGTPHYMSPEQARGRNVDHRSDLYSLGVVFYWLLMGRVPFNADSAVAVGIKHITEPVPVLPPPLQLLQPILDKMLAKLPQERFQTAAELAKALAAIDSAALTAAETLLKKQSGSERLTTAGSEPTASSGRADLVKRKPIKVRPQPVASPSVVAKPVEPVYAPAREYPHKASNSWWPWLLGFAVAGLVAFVVYFQQTRLNGKPVGEDWLVALGIVEASPRSLNTPASVTETVVNVAQTQAQAAVTDDAVRTAEEPVAQRVDEAEAGSPEGSIGESAANEASLQASPATASQAFTELRDNLLRLQNQLEPQLARWQVLLPQLQTAWSALANNSSLTVAESEQLRTLVKTQQQELGEQLIALAETAQSAGEPDTVGEWREAAERYFPALIEDARWRTLQVWLAQQQQISALLQQADEFLAQDQLTAPEGANAFARYTDVTALDADNPAALAGLSKIAQRYRQLAQSQLAKAEVDAAKRLIAKGQQVRPDLPDWRKLTETAEQIAQRQRQLADLLATADVLQTQGDWVAPAGVNAAQTLAEALRTAVLEPPLEGVIAEVKARQSRLAQDISERLLMLANAKAFAEAEELLLQSQGLLPETPALISAREQLQAATLAAQPRVEALRIAAEASQLSGSTAGPFSFAAGRSVNIQFAYRNFNAEATLVQAVLYDGTQTLEIAQVPVVINGAEGVKQFKIERPVEGYPSGRYQIHLLLDGQLLASENFNVQ